LGEVNGEKIAYADFNTKVEQNEAQFKQQGPVSPQIQSYVQETTWNQMVAEAVLQKEVEKLGLQVGDDELNSMITGNNPNQQIIQAFTDPKTGQFDKARLNNFIQQLPKLAPDIKAQWENFVNELANQKLSEKYISRKL
jgi:peptidyl-prolyl cis-trans isomerase D